MEPKTQFQSLAFIKFLVTVFRIIFFISAFGIMLTVLLKVIVLATDLDIMKTMTLPVLFSFSKDSSLLELGGDNISNLKMTWGLGFVSTSALPKSFAVALFLSSMVAISCGLISLRLTISILETVELGDFLIVKNAIRLRWIAIIGIASRFLYYIGLTISHAYLSDKVDLVGFNFRNIFFHTFFADGTVFIWLFLLVLAEVFRVGAKLKEESELTI